MNQYKNLIVWQRSISLATQIYNLTSKFPQKEKFGLINQLNRCSISIASNIAEGSGTFYEKSFLSFLSIAYASTCELETQCIISFRLGYISKDELNSISKDIEAIQKMIYKLKQTLRSK